MKGGLRTTQLGLECELRAHIPIGHPIVAWMVRLSAMLRNIFVVSDDGKTAWQRARGSPCDLKLVQFGAIARYKCRSTEKVLEDPETNGALEFGSVSSPGQDSISCLIPGGGDPPCSNIDSLARQPEIRQ